ncbi:molybdate ABC transporter substrate-binding protein [Sphingomonas sp. 28-63-12]|uniref:molybdate ABC transporter substrate-binding protein n=1 Tax=Sphingomonas sp. 28-63-12 TaxID=1970434 RepID=UPI000BDB48DB|nr:MAG: molybdate ABC transporter substrate-binding protein [Sphingomonas sp. 28-63-12]
MPALLALLGPAPVMAADRQPPLVLAAASLQESISAAANAWAASRHPRPVISFAASSTLARQLAAGAPADLFVSADETWMDDLAGRGLIAPGTRVSFLGNSLVLVAPATSKVRVEFRNPARLAALLSAGALAMADTESVPAGKYGKAALLKLGVWSAVSPKVVRAENVRAALALVERGAAPLGIVYATDARASSAVRVVGVFPAATYPAISYPVARLKASVNPEGEGFRRFLVSRAGKAIFVRYGFSVR